MSLLARPKRQNLPGFGLHVSPKGRKTWAAQYCVNGIHPIEQRQQQAVAAEAEAEANELRFAKLAARYVAEYANVHTRPKTARARPPVVEPGGSSFRRQTDPRHQKDRHSSS